MKFMLRTIVFSVAISSGLLSSVAFAGDDPCGNFDFTGGLACKIEVSGGCSAQCQPFNFEVGCTGQCVAVAQPACVDTCGVSCLKECDPALLDCFEGCHAECDAPVQSACEKKAGKDCANTSKAQCDIHCKAQCKVPSSTCEEHCQSCCTGGCNTQVNYDCDYSCIAKLQGGCDVQCQKPEGALFCNGQYVHASDITACVSSLLTKGITVDASATATCNVNGCNLDAAVSGCSTSGVAPVTGYGGAAFGAVALGLVVARSRRKRSK